MISQAQREQRRRAGIASAAAAWERLGPVKKRAPREPLSSERIRGQHVPKFPSSMTPPGTPLPWYKTWPLDTTIKEVDEWLASRPHTVPESPGTNGGGALT